MDALFDENKKLQIYAGGSLSAQQIIIPDDNSVSGNSSAALRFGIDRAIGTLTGNEIAVPAATSTTIVKVEDIDYTCLLYTSPSPRDLSTSRMPSSA